MRKRIISTFGLWLTLIISIVLFGADAGTWLIAICSTLAQYELYKLLERAGYKPMNRLGLALGFILIPAAYYSPYQAAFNGGVTFTLLSIIVLLVTLLSQPDKDFLIRSFFPTLFGFILIPFMLLSYINIMHYYTNNGLEREGVMLCLWLIAVAKFADVGGLIVGKHFGRNKLAPSISPNKTWEGVAGGLIFSTFIGMILFIFFNDYFPEQFTVWHAGIISIPIAGCGIISDLIESIIKRQANAKDSGNIIPGIGGAFDLVDSLVLSAPVGYILLTFFLF